MKLSQGVAIILIALQRKSGFLNRYDSTIKFFTLSLECNNPYCTPEAWCNNPLQRPGAIILIALQRLGGILT
jgi:hypothetical protein